MADIEFQFKNKLYRLTDDSMTMHTKTLFGSEKLDGSVEIEQIEILYFHPEEDKKLIELLFTIPGRDAPLRCEVSREDCGTLQNFYDALIARGAVDRPLGRWKAGFAVHTMTEEKRAEERAQNKAKAAEQKALKKAEAEEVAAAQRRRVRLRAGCKAKQEEKYTCTRCGTSWFSNNDDIIRNFANATNFNLFTMNQVKDLSRCPKCGSKATTRKKVKYWVDKKGNCVDMEE